MSIWTIVQIIVFLILNLPGMLKAIADLFHIHDNKPAAAQAFVSEFHSAIADVKARGGKNPSIIMVGKPNANPLSKSTV